MQRPEILNVFFHPGLGDNRLQAVSLAAHSLQATLNLEKKLNPQKKATFTYVRPLNFNAHNYPAVEREVARLYDTTSRKKDNSENISLVAISGAVSVILDFALRYPQNVDAIVCFAGWIQLHEALKYEKNIAFVHAVHILNHHLREATEKQMEELTRKTLIVRPKQDKRVPLAAQALPGTEVLDVQDTSHLSATTGGLLREVLYKESLVHKWLTLFL